MRACLAHITARGRAHNVPVTVLVARLAERLGAVIDTVIHTATLTTCVVGKSDGCNGPTHLWALMIHLVVEFLRAEFTKTQVLGAGVPFVFANVVAH